MQQITIKIYGDEAVRQKLLKLGGNLLNFGTAMRSIGQEFLDWYASRPFATEGGIYGQPWASLAPSTAREKAHKYPGRGILIASGKMQQSFHFTSGTQFMLLQNSSPYIDFHQTGTRNMPQRLVTALTDERINSVKEIIQSSVTEKLNQVGL